LVNRAGDKYVRALGWCWGIAWGSGFLVSDKNQSCTVLPNKPITVTKTQFLTSVTAWVK